MIVPANTQHVTPAGDWIPDGIDTIPARLPVLLELCESDTGWFGEKLDLSELAYCFGRSDPKLRGWWAWRWKDRDGKIVLDLGAAALVNTVTGVRVPLAEVPRLLGCDVGAAGVAVLLRDEAPAPGVPPMAAAPALPIADYYTTNKIGPRIPGKTRTWMLDNAKTMPGAHKVGRDWVISPVDYEAWLTEQDTARCRASAPELRDVVDARKIAESTLAKAGLRATKGGA